jgi:molybdenum cofactor cytidylyltransferase
MNIGAIILAAGLSSRMGDFKPLLQLGGRSLIDRCSGAFILAGVEKILVVSGHRARDVEDEVAELGLQVVYNPDYASGMYSSVCTGVRQLSGIQGFFLLPADIPLVRPATIRTLLDAFDGRTVLYPSFDGLRGHPPLIPAALIPAILDYSGRQGLKRLLEKQRGQDIPVWDQGILLDADTAQDFAQLEQRLRGLTIGERAEALALAGLVMPERVREHGLAVAKTAEALGRGLNAHGCSLDLGLLFNAALLHDIAKGLPKHEKIGAGMLRDLGLGRLAPLVVSHRDTLPPSLGTITESEVVFLADKLIQGTQRIRLEERFTKKLKLLQDDPKASGLIRFRMRNALAIQAMIEKIIGRTIEELFRSEGQ